MQKQGVDLRVNLALFEQAFNLFHQRRIDEASVSTTPLLKFEKRGVKLSLFQRVRDECLKRDATTPCFWSIGRVSALVVGNHEILKAGNRWEVDQGGQAIDPSSTLTHAGQCSLIEAIRQGRFKAHDAPLGGDLRYDDVVGAKADIFVSFAYACDFIELVDALERFFESSPSLDKNSTYLWFDLFVNDQWTALDKPFEWWATTFKEAVEEIGHTLVILLPWEAPIPLTRVWCLFEVACSKKLSVALSSKQVKAFHDTLREVDGVSVITTSLCKIELEKATSYLPEDRQKIFAVVAARQHGFHGLNVDVSAKLREWVEAQAKERVTRSGRETFGEGGGEGGGGGEAGGGGGGGGSKAADSDAIGDLYRLGELYASQGKFEEASDAWAQVLQASERVLGLEHEKTVAVMSNLAAVYGQLGRYDESQAMFMYSLEVNERVHGIDHHNTLNAVNNIAAVYIKQGHLVEAEAMLQRSVEGYEKSDGIEHAHTLHAMVNLAVVVKNLGRFTEAEALYMRAIEVQERTLGAEHPSTLNAVFNLGILYYDQGKYDKAEELIFRALVGREKALGVEHAETKATASSLFSVRKKKQCV